MKRIAEERAAADSVQQPQTKEAQARTPCLQDHHTNSEHLCKAASRPQSPLRRSCLTSMRAGRCMIDELTNRLCEAQMVHQKHASRHTHLCQHAMVRVGHQHHYTGPVEYAPSQYARGLVLV